MADPMLREAYSRFCHGDKEAFTEIYEQLKRPVYTICWRILQSHEEAEDITHDVFLKVYASGQAGEIRNVRAWILQIAHNMAVDLYRRKSRQPAESITDGIWEPMDQRLDLEAAIAKLSPEDKAILTMKINIGLTFAEIAQIVCLSLPAVYRKYRNALQLLKQELNGGME